mgnify:FL=1
MKIFELKCEAYLKSDIDLKNSFDVLSKFINHSIYKNEIYEQNDKNNHIKNYCFGNFYPTESDRIYKKNRVYEFIIRSINEDFIDALSGSLKQNINNSFISILKITKKQIEQFFIKELYTVTPVIVTDKIDESGRQLYWSLDYNGDMIALQKQLQNNLKRKLKQFYPEDIEVSNNFIHEIKNLNQYILKNSRIAKNN